jgi:hypothetical protein
LEKLIVYEMANAGIGWTHPKERDTDHRYRGVVFAHAVCHKGSPSYKQLPELNMKLWCAFQFTTGRWVVRLFCELQEKTVGFKVFCRPNIVIRQKKALYIKTFEELWVQLNEAHSFIVWLLCSWQICGFNH